MNAPRTTKLPYHSDSSELFESIADHPWAVFLDSGKPGGEQGRYDILSADPVCVLTTSGRRTEIRTTHDCTVSYEDPFGLLRAKMPKDCEPVPGLPFCGGAIGYLSYDLARRLEYLPALSNDDIRLPEMVVGIYDWALVVDHERQISTLVGQGRSPATFDHWERLLGRFSTPSHQPRGSFHATADVASNMDHAAYTAAFTRIKDYIRAGDCYQVNLAQRFSAPVAGHPWEAYKALRQRNPAPFSAYMNTPSGQILSASPERFLSIKDSVVETKPIKGTRARLQDPEQDAAQQAELQASRKDRAENVMIVDLLRNDISKNCAPGSVQVPGLFELESFASVHHLVSTVKGRLREGRDALDLLRGCFPGGSITGAPKLRAMEIIEELEPHRRAVYCGSIGYLGHDGRMDTSIAIRTLVWARDHVYFHAGGGIVNDSELEAEYQETYDKVAPMLALLNGNR